MESKGNWEEMRRLAVELNGSMDAVLQSFYRNDKFTAYLSHEAHSRDQQKPGLVPPGKAQQILQDFALTPLQHTYNSFIEKHPAFKHYLQNDFQNHLLLTKETKWDEPPLRINFTGVCFLFPVKWAQLCPPELFHIPVKFRQCIFKYGFHLSPPTDELGNVLRGSDAITVNEISFEQIDSELSVNIYQAHMKRFGLRDCQKAKDITISDANIDGIYFNNNTIVRFSCDILIVIGGFYQKSQTYGRFSAGQCQFNTLSMPGTVFAPLDGYNRFTISGCQFANHAMFADTSFNATVSICDSQFHGPAIFNSCTFKQSTSFDNVTFAVAPQFHEAKLHEDSAFETARFLDFGKEAAQHYSTLKHKMGALNIEIQMHRFHAYELKSRYNGLPAFRELLTKWRSFDRPSSLLVEKISSWVFSAVTDYHQDLLKPFFCLGFVGLYMAWLYAAVQGISCIDESWLANRWVTDICRYDDHGVWRSVVFSLQHTLWPLGVLIENEIWNIEYPLIKLTVFFHLLTATIIWFLLILGIRKRFKL